MSRTHVLFLGFSVTADKSGFAYTLAEKWRAEHGVAVSVCGLGGLHPIQLIYMINHIFRSDDYTHVVLDLNTAAWRRPAFTVGDYAWPIQFITESAVRAGLSIFMLNLYRGDTEYKDDIATRAIERVATWAGAPFLDLASKIYSGALGPHLLRDEVHVKPAGTAWYIGEVEAPILKWLELANKPPASPFLFSGNEFWTESFSKALGRVDEIFERTGYSLPVVSLREGESFEFAFDAPKIINGVSVVYGPDSGWLTLDCHGAGKRRFLAFDKNCYYRRLHVQLLTPLTAKSGVVTADSEAPTIKLLKGETYTGPRTVFVGQAFCSSETVLAISKRAMGGE